MIKFTVFSKIWEGGDVQIRGSVDKRKGNLSQECVKRGAAILPGQNWSNCL